SRFRTTEVGGRRPKHLEGRKPDHQRRAESCADRLPSPSGRVTNPRRVRPPTRPRSVAHRGRRRTGDPTEGDIREKRRDRAGIAPPRGGRPGDRPPATAARRTARPTDSCGNRRAPRPSGSWRPSPAPTVHRAVALLATTPRGAT